MRNITLLLLIFLCVHAYPNDTIVLTQSTQLYKYGRITANVLEITARHLITGDTTGNALVNRMVWRKGYDKISFISGTFASAGNTPRYAPQNSHQLPEIQFADCRLTEQLFRSFSGKLGFKKCRLKNLRVDYTEQPDLHLQECTIEDSLIIDKANDITLTLDRLQTEGGSRIFIRNSRLKEMTIISTNTIHQPDIVFKNDTITTLTLMDTGSDSNKYRVSYLFFDCHIENLGTIYSLFPNTHIVFANCTFGGHADLTNLSVSRIEFINCLNLDRRLYISFADDNLPGQLRIVNSDFEKLEPQWTENTTLVFDDSDNADVIGNTYESLLAKYRQAGKEESFKLVDLQYKAYRQHPLFHFLDGIWWEHGYNKPQVFLWIGFFLLFFARMNYRFWDEVQAAYPIVSKEGSYFTEANPGLAKMKRVLLYTTYIFFALKIDLGKLQAHSHGALLIWFFVQYLTGFLCLLFLVKAVLGI